MKPLQALARFSLAVAAGCWGLATPATAVTGPLVTSRSTIEAANARVLVRETAVRVTGGLGQVAQAPTPELSEEGQQMVQELAQCFQTKLGALQEGDTRTLEQISSECIFDVVLFDENGKVRADANERLLVLLRATGATLPKPQVEGRASVPLEPIPDTALFSLPVEIEGLSQRFLLDTGASNSLVSDRIADTLGLTGTPIPGEVLALFVVGEDCGDIEVAAHNLPPLAVDRARVSGLMGTELPESSIPGDVDGVLGIDFLSGFDMKLDPRARTLQLSPASTAPADAIPLEGSWGVMVAQAEVNEGETLSLLLDTGAEIMVLSGEAAERLGIDLQAAETEEVQGFCGVEDALTARLDRVKIGDREQQDLEAVVLQNELLSVIGVDGIVGQNFLNQYRQHWYFEPPGELGFSEKGSLVLEPLP